MIKKRKEKSFIVDTDSEQERIYESVHLRNTNEYQYTNLCVSCVLIGTRILRIGED